MLHFVIPFFNSENGLSGNVLAVHDRLERDVPGDFEVVLCDDGSTDGSRAVAEGLARSRPRLRVVGYAENRGRGYAVRFAARTCTGGVLIFSDLDLPQTTDLARIREMFDRLRDSRIVVGSRFLRESESRRIFRRALVGRFHRLAVRILLPRLRVKDPDAGFKGFDLDGLLALCRVSREDRWSWDMEVLTIARTNGFSIAEIPIDWNERHGAYSSSVRLLRDAWEELTGIHRIRMNLGRGLYKI